ncbi:S-adenosyl-L-methionine-dependent methyltransferase [Mycena alexandri]|uniref:DNA (cytosine-5-)-methyltransferase n=1 Tax=Mycena alexandri TaxID=1745969 RepID=A0AAD6SD17_9AGAR|nr:S-adenosyl-L-methionine-dependent methyltransferase [Mycena alexandri]
MPPPRPSAWEVSFPEEAAAAAFEALQISQSGDSSSGSSPLKRKNGGDNDDGGAQQRVSRAAYYKPPRNIVNETAEYTAPGEDPEPGHKPTRVLHNYCIFDSAARNELVSLDVLESNDDNDRQFAAAGIVLLPDEDDEDFGQEDGAEKEDGAENGFDASEEAGADYARLDNISLFPFDYFHDEPIFIETPFAFYELRAPSMRYKLHLLDFFAPRRVARVVLMNSNVQPGENLEDFLTRATESVEDLDEALPHIRQVLGEVGHGPGNWRNSALIQDLLRRNPSSQSRRRHQRVPGQQNPRRILGNPDLALLKPENQSPTHVTPLIAALAEGYFHEDLQVIGPRPRPPNRVEIEAQKARALQFLEACIARVRSQEIRASFAVERAQYEYGRLVEKATIGSEEYKTGDFVVIRKGHYRGVPAPLIFNIPDDAKLADYFWFARIMHFNVDSQKVHVQWLEHGSQIILQEFAHPQELFLNMLCEDQRVGWIGGKISVTYSNEPPRKHDHYFVRSIYDERDASFTSLDMEEMNNMVRKTPPNNCLPCARTFAYDGDAGWDTLRKKYPENEKVGIKYQGHRYHIHEFFLYNAATGPANIGYIENIQTQRRGQGAKIHFTKVGRTMRDLEGVRMNEDGHNIYPERHLFLTNEKATVLVNELVRPIHVYAWGFFLNLDELKRWVDYSPYNFYCSYRLPSLTVEPRAQSWAQRAAVPKTLDICEFCPSEMYRQDLGEAEFDAEQASKGYTCLDLFGGTGAFSKAIAEGSGGCLKPTHLIEITPSAARTAKKNSPNLVTYCQDANVILRYCIKSAERHDIEVPVQLWDNKTPVPRPLKPKTPNMTIVAGLPCQSHSGLNMFRKAEDRKSNLILTAASYVDFFRPDFFFLENVPGFLRYNLLAEQAGRYRVEGGVEMGGLKLLIRALLDMRYQIRFSLLQAGNYGAPQNRVRFFLIAARHGLPLPAMPQPTHDFEVTNQLRMKLPYNHRPQVAPIRTTRGRAAHAGVSIEDAIGDLPLFDWKHPDPKNASADLRKLQRERKQAGIPVLACVRDEAHCGFQGVVAYRHGPKTSFQREARERPVVDMQHYTRCLLPKTVERVVTIPLEAGANFRSLPPSLAEWQFFNPVSAVGRNRYRGSLYGRLDSNGSFPTTVTNMHPTAKQSKVLHPECLRMLTVREFARSQGFPDWFVFVSINDNVVTLHRQIGNAVPWQVSRALGRELRVALFEDWKKKDRMKMQEDVEMVE